MHDPDGVRKAAEAAHATAVAAEPGITEAVSRAVSGSAGRLTGLDQRIKTRGRAEAKIKHAARVTGLSPEQVAREMNDLVRYRVVIDERQYAHEVEHIIGALTADDIAEVRRDRRVTWGDDWYRAVNATFTPGCGGTLLEIQFHTPASLEAASAGRDLYEEYRNARGRGRQRARDRIARFWRSVPGPPGWERLT